MRQHAVRTAMTLYRSGTLDLETAAVQAGTTPERLRVAVARYEGTEPSTAPETNDDAERILLDAD